MSKNHRGRGLKAQHNRGRGTCPVTGQTGVKLLHEVEIEGKKVMVSKVGKATLANAKRAAEKAGVEKGAGKSAEKPAEKPVEQAAAEPAKA